ncbi:putative phosphatidylglycerophosphate synthase [Methanobrevibacter arboriphilus JCM 13429 = DSM 1125]|uniref:Putative phosphatidylglycerophosphate synthase n=1 Tax=Methanobrevibacter arboriphilus JCM 13429 = DSM 1125 TaxID=1300164 RepID=A0A1V6MZV1_METAZ|nr:CDP-alcohol phosphatidyltransferase family protein [Methanobrevibacter arboriphilus]OQD57971.1 putative phosphatidylglycerophosphate synthase [Methanobrevibacter arboriphilus JCM 13429 = DSM 1125]
MIAMIFQLTKNIPNILSSIRIIITIPFIFSLYDLILGTGSIISLLLFSIIIISDILDGYLARKLNFVSAFGANLDIFADIFYSFLSTTILCYLNVVPIWFLFIVIFKFLEFVITSKFLKNYKKINSTIHSETKKDNFLYFDWLGRSFGILTMLLPGLVCIIYLFSYQLIGIISYTILILTIIAISSTILRLIKIKIA